MICIHVSVSYLYVVEVYSLIEKVSRRLWIVFNFARS